MENILAQMVDDTPPVTRRIVSLLFNSFQPTDAEGEVQLTRTVALIQTNQAAARVFYQHAHRHMSIATAGKSAGSECIDVKPTFNYVLY